MLLFPLSPGLLVLHVSKERLEDSLPETQSLRGVLEAEPGRGTAHIQTPLTFMAACFHLATSLALFSFLLPPGTTL